MKTIISYLIIGLYILNSFRIRTGPWKYFQINARHFSAEKGIFSKLYIDKMIPEKWKLRQERLTENFIPDNFPVFIKPEWGQNAQNITRADNPDQLQAITRNLEQSDKTYIIQERAPESREFEIFTIFTDSSREECAILSVTEVKNKSHQFPINSIYNDDTCYHDITSQFSPLNQSTLIGYKQQIGKFGQSRLSVKADSIGDLLAGKFHVIELNLFTPMPIHLLDSDHSWLWRLKQILKISNALAYATRSIDSDQASYAIYTRMSMYGRSLKTLGVLRSFL